MFRHRTIRRLAGALALTSATWFPATALAQESPANAETAALLDQLRELEEQQKTLLARIEELELAKTQAAVPPAPAQTAPATRRSVPRYDNGIVLFETGADAPIPFSLRLNDHSQFRYVNTTAIESETYVDHLGQTRSVAPRNDFSINRQMFIFGGMAFDERLRYNLYVWASNSVVATVPAGDLSFTFSKEFTIHAGYWGAPGTRSLVQTFPYFIGLERSMADNFFRPGFTQGVWATGELGTRLFYNGFVGNGLNTLSIPTTKIDTNLMTSGSVWWEPLGEFGTPGLGRNMYDDFFPHEKVAIRVGTAFTHSREDRFTNLDQSNPENTSMYNSDGVLTFAEGAFAPGVTVDKATYNMWAIDGGVKWRGLAVNGQYFARWVGDFLADGPIPLDSMFDQGYEFSVSHYIVPKTLELYYRSSHVFGEFRDSSEYAPGLKWNFLKDHRVWLVGELMRVNKSPVGGVITQYSAGLTAWAPLVQWMINF